MFRALLAYPQKALHKRNLVYCMRVMSVGCYQGWSGTAKGLFALIVYYTSLEYFFAGIAQSV
jgi:hypothetical protein